MAKLRYAAVTLVWLAGCGMGVGGGGGGMPLAGVGDMALPPQPPAGALSCPLPTRACGALQPVGDGTYTDPREDIGVCAPRYGLRGCKCYPLHAAWVPTTAVVGQVGSFRLEPAPAVQPPMYVVAYATNGNNMHQQVWATYWVNKGYNTPMGLMVEQTLDAAATSMDRFGDCTP